MIAIRANPRFPNARIEHLYNLMKKQKYTDFIFEVRNRSIGVHMAVLSGCSDFFESNFNQFSDIFSGFDDVVIDAVLKYCYLGDIHIDESRVDKFMELANTLLIKNIFVEQKNPKYQTIDLSNCLEALWLSYNPITKNNAMSLTLENFLTLYKTPEFLHLPASTLIEILKSDYLNVSSEEDVFESVKLWTDHDRVNRKNVLSELLSSVRLTLLSIKFLTSEVMVYCYPSPECIIIVNEAMQLISSNRQNFILKDNHRKRSAKLAIFSTRHKTGVENFMDVYDRTTNKWTLSKDLRLDNFDYAPIVVNDWVVMISGQSKNSAVDYIDLKDGQKYSLNPLNAPRLFCCVVKLSQVDSSTDVYVVGGAEHWLKPINTIEKWNSKRRNWETNVAPMLLAVHSHAVSVVDGRIYVTGGCKLVKDVLEVVDKVQMYSPQTNSWSYVKPMIQKRRVHKSADINGRLFVVGGLKDIPILSVLASVESYDPGSDLWTLFCNLPSPRWGTAISLFGDKLLFIGGHDGTSYLTDVLEYDVMNEKWCILKSLNMARSGGDPILIPYNSAF
ncbi:kelch-like protein 25 [Arctopsyche grandis]|uniref:kelch-like protein 25 n=1 Tax=Arctopsyche grandis TaxID=121162 RepID=UPI00406D63EA